MGQGAYPVWMQKWNEKQDDIDQHLISHFRRTGSSNEEAINSVCRMLRSWMDRDGRGESVATDENSPQGRELRRKIQERIDTLMLQGKLPTANLLAQRPEKDGGTTARKR